MYIKKKKIKRTHPSLVWNQDINSWFHQQPSEVLAHEIIIMQWCSTTNPCFPQENQLFSIKPWKKRKTWKFCGYERAPCPESPCSFIHSEIVSQRPESGSRVSVSRRLCGSQKFEAEVTSPPPHLNMSPQHLAIMQLRKFHLFHWIPLNKHFQLLDFAVALSARV